MESNNWTGRTVYALAASCILVDGYRITYGQLRKGRHKAVFSKVDDQGKEVSGYLATYLLPFLTGPPDSGWKAAAFLVYFLVAWVVYINCDMLLINPTLYLLGWKVFRGERQAHSVVILAKSLPPVNIPFDAVSFAGGIVKFDE